MGVTARALIVFAFVLQASDAAARPGGGGAYHGGGGGGGGYHGGGYHGGYGGGVSFGGGYGGSPAAGGDGVGLFMFLVVGIIILAAFVAAQRRGAWNSNARAALLTSQRERTIDRSVSIDALRAHDPALTEESVTNHVRQMADILRQAWCAGDMRPARPFVSDGVFSRFQVQLALMRAESRRNVMSDARVLYATIEAVENAPPLDVVHVRLTAEARDTEVPVVATDAQIGAALARTPVESYTEIWSLVRRTGAQTKAPGFPVGLACPSCGAPLGRGEIIQCRYCGTLACSGEHDWVLAEITQLVEWHPRGTGDRPGAGLDALRARDPGVARETLEDRASYVFWKWVQAGRHGSAGPLRGCALPSFLAQGPLYLEAIREASDVAVGGAELLRCELDCQDRFDRAYVEVFWSARLGGSNIATPAKLVIRLARRSGAVSKLSMTALVCKACGSPLDDEERGGYETTSSKCDHCGAELTAGDQAWMLDRVLRLHEVELAYRSTHGDGMAAQPSGPFAIDVADPRQRRILFARMAQIMAADGVIDRRERRLLEMCAARWDISPSEAAATMNEPPRGEYSAALGVSEPELFLRGLVVAALADGRVDRSERALLERACQALGLSRVRLEQLLAEHVPS